jgi:hypothetical protein
MKKRKELLLVCGVLNTLFLVALATWSGYLAFALLGAFALSVGILLVIGLWRRPGTLLLIYILLLPAYVLSFALLFKVSQSERLVSLAQPWKEVLATAVLLILFVRIFLKARIGRFHTLDFLVLLYLALNILYLFVPWGPEFIVRLYGVRANAFFVLIYWLGRLVYFTPQQQKWVLRILIGVGVLAALGTIVEIIALPPNWPTWFGYAEYLRAFFNSEPTGNYGLAWTFETSTGLRRRSAFFANPLELASSVLITGAAALYWAYSYRPGTKGRWIGMFYFGLIVLSLLLSISRASLAAFVLQMFIASYWLKKNRFRQMFIAAGVMGAIVLFFFAGPALVEFVHETITFQNPSLRGHVTEWQEGAIILERPWGLGVGSSGQTGDRFGDGVGGESQYIIILVQLGFVGLGLYLLILLMSVYYSLKAFHRTTGVTKGLAFIAASAKLGLLIPSFSSHIENYLFTMFISWWLVGFAVQQLTAVRHPTTLSSHISSQEPQLANSR